MTLSMKDDRVFLGTILLVVLIIGFSLRKYLDYKEAKAAA